MVFVHFYTFENAVAISDCILLQKLFLCVVCTFLRPIPVHNSKFDMIVVTDPLVHFFLLFKLVFILFYLFVLVQITINVLLRIFIIKTAVFVISICTIIIAVMIKIITIRTIKNLIIFIKFARIWFDLFKRVFFQTIEIRYWF